LINYANPIVAELRANMVRADADFSATPFKAKIANAESAEVAVGWGEATDEPAREDARPTCGRDLEAGAVSVRLHHGGPQSAKPKGEVIAQILASIRERRA
jgi:hypothetical protein